MSCGRLAECLHVLRADRKAEIVKLPVSLRRLFTGRYALASGKRIFEARWRKVQLDAIWAQEAESPVELVREDERVYWAFKGCFYWEDEDLSAADVKALVLQRIRRRERQLATAHSLMRAEEAGAPVRSPVPVEMRRSVFERDGGRCVECGGSFDLQYDHVIPFSLGGATTVENLQLMCGDCNRTKGATL
jgi:hypothetical protein